MENRPVVMTDTRPIALKPLFSAISKRGRFWKGLGLVIGLDNYACPIDDYQNDNS
jgi:hypothetical protein